MTFSNRLLYLIGTVAAFWAPWQFVEAQVLTPSLNPAIPVLAPAAAGWRSTAAVNLTYFDLIGTRNLNNENIYEFAGTGYSCDLYFRAGERLAFEAYYYSDSVEVAKDTYYEGKVNLATTASRLSVTLSHEGFAVFGLGFHNRQTTDFISSAFPEEITTQTSTLPSMSIKLGSMFYLGGGMEIVKESSTHAVNNHWINTIGGLALMSEPNDTFMFRIETSVVHSPEALATAKQDQEEGVHHKTTVIRGNIEAKYKGLVVEFFLKDTTEAVELENPLTGEKVDAIHEIMSQFGFLIVPNEGLVLGFHFRSDSTKQLFTDQKDSFRITLAYVF